MRAGSIERTTPPSGYPPPTEARLPDGRRLDIRPLAAEICSRYRAEFPDEQSRYGEAGLAWCLHDNQYIVSWAVHSLHGLGVDLGEKVAWLASVLEARDFPLDRLARDLELAADVVSGQVSGFDEELTAELRRVAELVRSKT